LQLTSRACCRAGIHCSFSPEPLLIKDIKVQVNKQKPNSVRPAQMKHNSDKITIVLTSSQPCSKPNVVRSAFIHNSLQTFFIEIEIRRLSKSCLQLIWAWQVIFAIAILSTHGNF
jgi:hypothetical protein